METTMTTTSGCYQAAAALRVRVPSFVLLPRLAGGVRLIAVGGSASAPPGPPLTD